MRRLFFWQFLITVGLSLLFTRCGSGHKGDDDTASSDARLPTGWNAIADDGGELHVISE